MQQVEDVGVAVIGQSGNLTPADKKLYALRDVTATIDSLPLITSSIMSKKLAAGAHSIVLDVKIGSGAFMKTLEDGQKLAESMVRIGKACGRNVVAVMSNMDIPLGFYIGNALEVREAVEVLRGHGCPDLTGVCITLAANMLHLCNGWPIEEATKQAEEAISSGRAFEQMKRWIAAQGGDARVLDDVSLLPQAAVQYELKAPQAGYIHHMDAQKIGESSAILGAGRKTKDDTIDFAAGIVLKEKTGAKVRGIELSLLQRCGAHLASLTDIQESFLSGKTAVLEAISGTTDKMVGFERKYDEKGSYVCGIKLMDLTDVANTEKKVPLEWINREGNNVNKEFIDYALPLIQGTPDRPLENGLPRFARLKKIQAK